MKAIEEFKHMPFMLILTLTQTLPNLSLIANL